MSHSPASAGKNVPVLKDTDNRHVQMIGLGVLLPRIVQRLSLERITRAHEAVDEGRAGGRRIGIRT
jgi:hypothetical protein